jgi:two-component system sensor histidine kinase TctE
MSRPGAQPRRLGFRAFLLRWSAIPLAFIAALSVTASYFVARDYADRAFDTALFDTARALAQQVEAGRGNLSERPITRAIIEFDPVDKVYYRITDATTGELLAANADIAFKVIEAPFEGNLQMADGRVGDTPVRAVTLVAQDANGRRYARVIYAETLKKRDILGARLFAAVLVPQLLIVLAAGLLVWFGVRRATGPLEQLAEELLRRSGRDLRPVPAPRQVREVGLVAIAVNRLIRRLRRAAMAQQAFIGNAAHQLRTPLAGIIAQSDRLMDEADPERVRVALGHLQRSARRATRTVNQLLTLARSEPDAEGALALHPLDLAAVVREVCTEWVPEALERGVDLGYVGPDGPVGVVGDESLLREMLSNLIDNALRYGARPGVVNVRLETDPVVLAVEDDGPGIPEAERENVFRRFYRVPEADAGGTGSGLGLAIVREIAILHGARTRVLGGTEGRGTIVEVRFAVARD